MTEETFLLYQKVSVCHGKKKISTVNVHVIVAETFIGRLTVNHKDGNKNNNCVDNLEYVTYSENNKHVLSTGLRTPYKPPRFTNEEAEIIRNRYKEPGVTHRQLSKEFNAGSNTICAVLNHKSPYDLL